MSQDTEAIILYKTANSLTFLIPKTAYLKINKTWNLAK